MKDSVRMNQNQIMGFKILMMTIIKKILKNMKRKKKIINSKKKMY